MFQRSFPEEVILGQVSQTGWDLTNSWGGGSWGGLVESLRRETARAWTQKYERTWGVLRNYKEFIMCEDQPAQKEVVNLERTGKLGRINIDYQRFVQPSKVSHGCGVT